MHIRQQGSNLALIRTTYDAERRRGVQTTVGRIPANTRPDGVPHELRAQLTDEESNQLDDYLKARADGERLESQKTSLNTVTFFLSQAAAALDAGIEPKDPAAIWDAMAAFQKALKKSGHTKPTRAGETAKDAA